MTAPLSPDVLADVRRLTLEAERVHAVAHEVRAERDELLATVAERDREIAALRAERDEARDFADVARADVAALQALRAENLDHASRAAVMTAERNDAREESAALRERLTRAEHAVIRCHAAELLSEGQAAKLLAGSASDIDRIDLRDRVLAHEEALRAEGRAEAEARTAVPPPRDALPGLRALAASEAAAEVLPAEGDTEPLYRVADGWPNPRAVPFIRRAALHLDDGADPVTVARRLNAELEGVETPANRTKLERLTLRAGGAS